jgi:hypothetical protein
VSKEVTGGSDRGDRDRRRAVSRKSLIPFAALIAVTLVAGVSVGAVATVHHLSATPSSTTSSTNEVVRWRVPHGQTLAPVVPISGGATAGEGGFNGVSCPTANKCVAVGGDNSLDGVASVSNDGGSTWSQGALAAGEPDLFGVDCPSATECVAVGRGASVKSTDGGATWKSVSLTSQNTTLLSVSCPNTTLCVSVGVSPSTGGPYGGDLLVSNNGGTSWSSASLPASAGALGSVDCPSATFCVAVGASIVVSTDGAKKWDLEGVQGGSGVLRSVSCESVTSCIALGPNPAVAQDLQSGAFEVTTNDGGHTWTSNSTPPSSAALDVITCVRGSTCEAVGSSFGTNGSLVLRTGDNGSTWTSISVPSNLTGISTVSCPSSSSCVYAGSQDGSPVVVGSSGNQVTSTQTVTSQVRTPKELFRK